MSKATFDNRRHNRTANTEFAQILQKRLKRRTFLSAGAAAAFSNGFFLAGCGGSTSVDSSARVTVVESDNAARPVEPAVVDITHSELGFDSIPGSLADGVSLPPGYSGRVLAPWGDPLFSDSRPWQDDGSNTAKDQALSVGMQHDGMKFFPVDGNSADGLLCVNHEYVDPWRLHADRISIDSATGHRDDIDQARKEINCVGVSVFRVSRERGGWKVIPDDSLNRRYTAATEFRLAGPLALSEYAVTRYSPQGSHVRGTLGNCGNGSTPWGTYLTCEEHWPAFFVSKEPTADQIRMGFPNQESKHNWEDFSEHADQLDGEFARFSLAAHADSAQLDYRNEANGFGYVVEIDPYSASGVAVKRTALGRFRHEGCAYGLPEEGKPLVFYSGHDGVFEYVYKFVSHAVWDPSDAQVESVDRLTVGDKYMDHGTLYVARFDEDGTGIWLPLTLESETTRGTILGEHFSTDADLIVNTLTAADLVGATPMDRPEWTAVDPVTGSVYLTLTGNHRRGEDTPIDSANPRANNEYGHIIRWEEVAGGHSFKWDIFVYGASANDSVEVNRSGLTLENQFSGPDGLVFDERGILWIQTDSSGDAVAEQTNDQILAVIPSANRDAQGNQDPVADVNNSELRRFMVGPGGCEITGVTFTPDSRTMFVNVQHPSNWPYSENASEITPEGLQLRARSATVVIERDNGEQIGL